MSLNFPLPPKQELDLKRLAGKRVGVDFSCYAYKFIYGNKGFLGGLVMQLNDLFSAGIEPIYVFEGKAPIEKRLVLETRFEKKEKLFQELKYNLDNPSPDNLKRAKALQRFMKLTPENFRDLTDFLDACGLGYIYSNSESDFELACLEREGITAATFSQDRDLLALGSKLLVHTFKMKYYGYTPESFLANNGLDRVEDLVEASFILGNDYFPGKELYGPKKSILHVKSGKPLSELFNEEDTEKILDLKKYFLNPYLYRNGPNRRVHKRRPPNFLRVREIMEYKRYTEAEISKFLTNLSRPRHLLSGPLFTSGSLHYGTLLNTSLKSYITSEYNLPQVWGFDVHGLPVENAVINLTGRKPGVGDPEARLSFLKECAHYSEKVSNQMRVDLERFYGPAEYYYTNSPEFQKELLGKLKILWDREQIYRGERVLPLCLRCPSLLANAEIERLSVEVPSVTLSFYVPRLDADLLIWTTTPWSVPLNQAVAISEEITYLSGIAGDRRIIFREGYLPEAIRISTSLNDIKIISVDELLGLEYIPPYPIPGIEYKIYSSELVKDSATGIVHISTPSGEEDYEYFHDILETSPRFNLETGRYLSSERVPSQLHGMEPISLDRLIKEVKVYHHEVSIMETNCCWKCKTPISYDISKQYFLRVSNLRERILENLKFVDWRGDGLKRMTNWISIAKDWCISRSRNWGTPLPIFICPSGHQYWSSDMVPPICHETGQPAKWINQTLDVWMDSGMVSIVLGIYDAIVLEGLDQTRGWFYAMAVLGTHFLDEIPYRQVITHGWILEGAAKMSKSKGKQYNLDLEPHLLKHSILSKNARNDIIYEQSSFKISARVFNRITNSVNFILEYLELSQKNLKEILKQRYPLEDKDKFIISLILKAAQVGDFSGYPSDYLRVWDNIVDVFSTFYIQISRKDVWRGGVRRDAFFKTSLFYLHYVLGFYRRQFPKYFIYLGDQTFPRPIHNKIPQLDYFEDILNLLERTNQYKLGLGFKRSDNIDTFEITLPSPSKVYHVVRNIRLFSESLNVINFHVGRGPVGFSIPLVRSPESDRQDIKNKLIREINQFRISSGRDTGEILMISIPTSQHRKLSLEDLEEVSLFCRAEIYPGDTIEILS